MFTNQKDINDNEICEGDIVEFNPIGSTDVKRGKVIKFQKSFVIQISENPMQFYNFDSIFGRAKIIKNI